MDGQIRREEGADRRERTRPYVAEGKASPLKSPSGNYFEMKSAQTKDEEEDEEGQRGPDPSVWIPLFPNSFGPFTSQSSCSVSAKENMSLPEFSF